MRDAATLRKLAAKFRTLAEQADDATAANLRAIAEEYEQQASELEPQAGPPLPTID